MGCCSKAEWCIGKIFGVYGRAVNKHPVPAIIFAVLLNGLLSINIKWMQTETDFPTLYVPHDTNSEKNAQTIMSVFSDGNSQPFYPHQLVDGGLYATVIFKAPDNIIQQKYKTDIYEFNTRVLNIQVNGIDGRSYTLEDVCVRQNDKCYVLGSRYLNDSFWIEFSNGILSYDYSGNLKSDLHWTEGMLGSVQLENGVVISAKSLRMTYFLRYDTEEASSMSKAWENEFLKQMSNFKSNLTDIFITNSQAHASEFENYPVFEAIFFIIISLILLTFSFFATIGGNCLTQQGHLGVAGFLSAGLAIVGAFGLCAAAEVKYENLVGIMPFYIIGIGLSNTFILLSGLTDAPLRGSVDERICHTMRTSGVSITVASLSDFAAFMCGYMSDLVSVQNFCIYSGVAVILCYINQLTFVLACLVLHERRVAGSRHSFTCMKVYSKDEMWSAGYRNKVALTCCSGVPAGSKSDMQSFSEKPSAQVLPKVLLSMPVKVIIMFLYLGYLGVTIWGSTNTQNSFHMADTLRQDSDLYQFKMIEHKDFSVSLPVSFVIEGKYNYQDSIVYDKLANVVKNAQESRFIDDNFEINWLKEYLNQGFSLNVTASQFYNQVYLFTQKNPVFANDIIFDRNRTSIIWSRVHVLANKIQSSAEQGQMLERVRDIAAGSSLNMFAYGTSFPYFEQFVSVSAKTIQIVGISFCICVVVTSIFIIHPVLIFLVLLTMASITVGVFGFMSFWEIRLNSFTMAYLTIGVGLSVNYCIYMINSFMKSDGDYRKNKTNNAIIRTSGPILNSSISLIVGSVIFLFFKSYVFIVFFKIMLLAVLCSLFHSIVILPIVLSVVGPLQTGNDSRQGSVSKAPLFPNRTAASWSIHTGTGVNGFDDVFKGIKSQNKRFDGQQNTINKT